MRLFPRSLAVVAVVAASALALSACATTADTKPSATSESGVVSTMYGDVTVPAASDDLKVVALGWSDAEMALALGVVPAAVYDWQGFGEENKGVGPWATDLFGDTTPEIISNSGDAINFEQIQALSPDLILNTRAANDEKVFDRLSEIAPTVYAPAGTAAFATAWDVQLEQVGAALGKSDEAHTREEETTSSIADAAAAHPNSPASPPSPPPSSATRTAPTSPATAASTSSPTSASCRTLPCSTSSPPASMPTSRPSRSPRSMPMSA